MRKSRGVSLIEVLISLVILSVGVLAVVALQMIAKRNNMDAGERTIAAQLAYNMLERMRVNSTADALAVYIANATPYVGRGSMADPEISCIAPAGTDPANGTSYKCAQDALARRDVYQWQEAIDGAGEKVGTAKVGGLTMPTACIEGPGAGGSGVYTVTIAWRGKVEIPDRNSDDDDENDIACGDDATEDAVRIYGPNDEFRRTVSITAYITARVAKTL